MSLQQQLDRIHKRFDSDYNMVTSRTGQQGYHTALPRGTEAHNVMNSFHYALLLTQSPGKDQRDLACRILRKVLPLQDSDPTSPTYGVWPWFAEEPLDEMDSPDLNWADFCGARCAQILKDSSDWLPDDLQDEIKTALYQAALAIIRRNMGPGYTNIAIMGGGVTAAAGEILKQPCLLQYGRKRLQDVVSLMEACGSLSEYNSPTYTVVAVNECERIHLLVSDPEARSAAETIRQEAWRVISEHWHPGTSEWAGPHARAYADRISKSTRAWISSRVGFDISFTGDETADKKYSVVPALPCPDQWRDRIRELPETPISITRTFIQRPSSKPPTIGTTWFSDHACLGTVNHENLWEQRRPLIGYWRLGETDVAVLRARMLHNGKDFTSGAIWSTQDGPRALSGFGLLTNLGSMHPSFDKPEHPVFDVSDLRIRYQLSGPGVSARQLAGDSCELRAGDMKAVVHAAPLRFNGAPRSWEITQGDDWVALDAVLYAGESHPVDIEALAPYEMAAGLELLPADATPSNTPVGIHSAPDDTLKADWGGELVLEWPASPGPYVF